MDRNIRLRGIPFRAHSWAEWFALRADAEREYGRWLNRTGLAKGRPVPMKAR